MTLGVDELGTVSKVATLGRMNFFSRERVGSGMVESEEAVSSMEVLGVEVAGSI